MKEILIENGLTDQEATLYISLLANGQLSAYDLAEKTGLYRQYTYDALKRMQEKGFVSSMKEGRTKQYVATDPELVLSILKSKTKSYEEILPELNSLKQGSQAKIEVETYQGSQALSIALKDVIKEIVAKGGENLCTGVDESFAKDQYKIFVDQFERDLVHYKIKERVLVKKGTKGLFQKGETTYREIPAKLFNPNFTQVYGDCVQTFTWGHPNTLVIIRSKDVADSYRKQFELMWLAAKLV